jgi:hypothetical protein
MTAFFQHDRFIDPRIPLSGGLRVGAGFVGPLAPDNQGLFLYETTLDQFNHDFPMLTRIIYENVTIIERSRKEWRPIAEKLLPIMLWAGKDRGAWSAYCIIDTKIFTLVITFADPISAVECKLIFD